MLLQVGDCAGTAPLFLKMSDTGLSLNLHATNQALVKFIHVSDLFPSQDEATRVTCHLPDHYLNPTVAQLSIVHRSEKQPDFGPLAKPIVTDRFSPYELPTLPAIRPLDISGHGRKDPVDVAGVERLIQVAELLRTGRHQLRVVIVWH